MKIWFDSHEPAPYGYIRARTPRALRSLILQYSNHLDWDMNICNEIELISVSTTEDYTTAFNLVHTLFPDEYYHIIFH